MRHDEAQALWLLADDGALDGERQEALRAHLAECAGCRAEVDRLAAADLALRAWGAASVPAPVAPVTLIGTGRVRPWIPVAAAAALAGITLGSLGGYLAGQRVATNPAPAVTTTSPDPRPTFVLLLEEPAGQWPPQAALARPGYFEWMDSLMARGQFDDGVRLAEDDGWYLATGGTAMPAGQRPVAAPNYSGLFVIRARDYDEAVAIARESPHLNYGGVLVRRTY